MPFDCLDLLFLTPPFLDHCLKLKTHVFSNTLCGWLLKCVQPNPLLTIFPGVPFLHVLLDPLENGGPHPHPPLSSLDRDIQTTLNIYVIYIYKCTEVHIYYKYDVLTIVYMYIHIIFFCVFYWYYTLQILRPGRKANVYVGVRIFMGILTAFLTLFRWGGIWSNVQ